MRFWLLNLVLLFDIFGKKCLIDSDYCPIKMGRLLLLNSHVCILFCDSFLPHVNSKTQFCSLQYHLLMRIAFLRFNGRKSVFNSIQTNAISQEIKLRFSKEKNVSTWTEKAIRILFWYICRLLHSRKKYYKTIIQLRSSDPN